MIRIFFSVVVCMSGFQFLFSKQAIQKAVQQANGQSSCMIFIVHKLRFGANSLFILTVAYFEKESYLLQFSLQELALS